MQASCKQLVHNPVFACIMLVRIYGHVGRHKLTPVCNSRLYLFQLGCSLGEPGYIGGCLELRWKLARHVAASLSLLLLLMGMNAEMYLRVVLCYRRGRAQI